MHIVLVEINVKPDFLEAFEAATRDNARNSLQEKGILRFDVLRKKDNPCRFVLVEVYRRSEDQVAHRETAHYQCWRDQVAEMMAETRVGTAYENLFPDDSGWVKA